MAIKYIIINGGGFTGKTTIARWLARELSWQGITSLDSFATPLRQFVQHAVGETFHEISLDRLRAELSGHNVRDVMDDMNDWLREGYGDDILGKWLIQRTLRKQPTPEFVVVDDGGYPCPFHDGVVVRVERKNHPAKDTLLPNPQYTIQNDGGLDQLFERTRVLASWIMVG